MIYLARKEFGISARELLAGLPGWEVDLLFSQRDKDIREENRAREKAARGDY